MNTIEPLLLPVEVSNILRVTQQHLANWRSQGKGPVFLKNGTDQRSRVYYKKSDVEDFIDRQRSVADGMDS